MQISVYAIGRKMPAWVQQASNDYVKRMPRRWQFAVREFPQGQGDTSDIIMAKEAGLMLDAIPHKAHVIALDNRGSSWSTS
ncbi:MAG: 23S rRNA (pseudouridine1915-N3)-methyltransferase, partial [Pseudomonadales bacterium]